MGRLPRFPYGGTNRIRFKGYNLSRMAPPSKMLMFCLLCCSVHCISALHTAKVKAFSKTQNIFYKFLPVVHFINIPFGNWGLFPNKVSFLRRTVQGKGWFPKRSNYVAGKRSFFYLCAPAGCPIAQEIGRKVRAGKGSALWKAQIGEEFMQG